MAVSFIFKGNFNALKSKVAKLNTEFVRIQLHKVTFCFMVSLIFVTLAIKASSRQIKIF